MNEIAVRDFIKAQNQCSYKKENFHANHHALMSTVSSTYYFHASIDRDMLRNKQGSLFQKAHHFISTIL